MKLFRKIGIIGAGSYGTAIAQCFSLTAERVILISNSATTATSINKLHMNIKSLPGIGLNSNINCTCDFSVIRSCDVVFIVVPVMAVESVCQQLKDYKINKPIVLCSKGFDVQNGQLLSSLAHSILENDIAIFSGPSFAKEIAQGLPAGVNVASENFELAQTIAKSLSSDVFTIEPIEDFAGLQIAGAMKNILAVGCGILSGLNMGNSAISQLIVRGLHEMIKIAASFGGKKETFFELGGIGDIILTCTSKQSRNVLFGEYLARGGKLKDWNGSLVEGAFAAQIIPIFSQKLALTIPIFSEIYKVIYEDKCAQDMISAIL
ncbi:MAG: NAD(P)H-dependent glycerol-3-phosphate dehydrogenase [Alphaproteobacteria bacterium]|nr:NAD(P)H-dependent glycerol-3-phosphate dehydrogenase [Alphaproteobacteria bacterium]